MSFNIKTKQLSDTTILNLVDPGTGLMMFADDAETQPLQIEVYGKSSKAYRNWQASASRKALARGKKQVTPEEAAENTADFLVAVSKQAMNFDIDGVAIDSPAMFKLLYSDPSLYWIGDQVAEKLGETEAFLQK